MKDTSGGCQCTTHLKLCGCGTLDDSQDITDSQRLGPKMEKDKGQRKYSVWSTHKLLCVSQGQQAHIPVCLYMGNCAVVWVIHL